MQNKIEEERKRDGKTYHDEIEETDTTLKQYFKVK